MQRWIIAFLALACLNAAAQEDPKPTDLAGNIYAIRKTWTIGGEGNWDYLTLDPNALQLFVAHGSSVQVVDVSAGSLAGQVKGMRDAHGIALDDSGAVGYVSDGPANMVRVFDRQSLQVVASVPTGPNPRAVVYEPLTKLVFAICTQPIDTATLNAQTSTAAQAKGAKTQPRSTPRPGDSEARSVVTVIDSQSRLPLANLLLPGRLGYALTDGRGEVYVSLVDLNRVGHFDAQAVLAQLQQLAPGNAKSPAIPVLDLSGPRGPNAAAPNLLHAFRLGSACPEPVGLAVDGEHLRLFTACNNQKMEVLNTGTGEVVATLPIGPGAEAIGYDATRGLIYTANGGGLGSLTVIRQDVNDSYAVVQNLPTQQRARTLAVNPTSGEIYLVTNLEGFDLNKKGTGGGAYTLPVVNATPVTGSFQVLVVGTN